MLPLAGLDGKGIAIPTRRSRRTAPPPTFSCSFTGGRWDGRTDSTYSFEYTGCMSLRHGVPGAVDGRWAAVGRRPSAHSWHRARCAMQRGREDAIMPTQARFSLAVALQTTHMYESVNLPPAGALAGARSQASSRAMPGCICGTNGACGRSKERGTQGDIQGWHGVTWTGARPVRCWGAGKAICNAVAREEVGHDVHAAPRWGAPPSPQVHAASSLRRHSLPLPGRAQRPWEQTASTQQLEGGEGGGRGMSAAPLVGAHSTSVQSLSAMRRRWVQATVPVGAVAPCMHQNPPSRR